MLTDITELEAKNNNFEGATKPPQKENFRFDKVIGSGSFGKVFRAVSRNTGDSYAIKMISKSFVKNLTLEEQLKNEIKILMRCNHENIVKIFACFEDPENIYVVMELAEESLFKKLVNSKKFTEVQTSEILTQVLRALNYLHSLSPPVLHRDLKPENVLCIRDRYVLADFGWSNLDNNLRNTFCGTPDYLAPEMINGQGHNEKLDIWTVGVLFYELIVGRPPFSSKEKITNKRLQQKMIEKNIMEMKFDIPEGITMEAVTGLKRLMAPQPASRPSAKEAFDLDFFKKNNKKLKNDVCLSPNSSINLSVEIENQKKINLQLKAELDKANEELNLLRTEKKLESTGELDIIKKKLEDMKTENEKLAGEIQNSKNKSVKDDDIKHYLFERGKQIATFVSDFHRKNLETNLNVTMDNVLSYENTLGKLEVIFREYLKIKGKNPDTINETLPPFDENESRINFAVKFGTALNQTNAVRITTNDNYNKKIFNPSVKQVKS